MTSPTLPQATSDAASLLAPAAESVPLMRKAARPLVGEHDFAAFCRSRTGTTTTRRLRSVTVRRLHGLVEVRLLADAPAGRWVPSIVEHLLQTGAGRRGPASTAAVLATGDRTAIGNINIARLPAAAWVGRLATWAQGAVRSRRRQRSSHRIQARRQWQRRFLTS
jgi:tRNA U38,U39,U40 pseudouridine synthase TruA